MQELQKYHEVRYVFEHRLLPAWFYCAGEETLQGIPDRDAAFLWRKWKLLCGAAGLEMTDAKNPFKVSKRTIDDKWAIVRIGMPHPDGQALCFYVYLVWSGDYESRGYFTVERGASPKVRYLCSWTEGRQHCNHGKCSPHAAGVERKIANLFAGRSPGIREKWGRLFRPMPERPHRGGDCPVYGNVEEMLDSARQYASEQNYAEAIKLWSVAAEQGYARAQYNLGISCEYGHGVKMDMAEACRWYRKAAEQGHAGAQAALGTCYRCGDGVAQDYAEACRWHRKAAEQGHAAAQYALGICHAFGDGVEEDPAEAYQWCRKAAEQGLADAQYFLGDCFFHGNGIEENNDEAYRWYRKAAGQGDAAAQRMVGECYSYGYGVAEDDTEALIWYIQAAEQGDAQAQYALASIMFGTMMDDEDIDEDRFQEACRLCRASAGQGCAMAQHTIGTLYENGIWHEGRVLIEQDREKALEWYAKAAAKGHEEASDAWDRLMGI